MILDALSLAPGTTLEADLCIVGGGAAGLSLASALEDSGLSVLLLEAGGRKFDPRQQDGLQGSVAPGSSHSPPHMYRRRVLGGATAIWGGRCVPFDPIDLEARDWVERSGWPIGWDDLAAYYPAAQVHCEAGAYAYDVGTALPAGAPPTIEGFSDPDLIADRLERFSRPTDFGKSTFARLTAARQVRILLNAQALRLVTEGAAGQAGPVQRLEAASAPGRGLTVRARRYVLATGGLEVPRLLMASDESRRGGLGNESGALGRYYMCHAENTLGRLRLTPSNRPVALDFEVTEDGTYVRRKFGLSAAAQRREGLLNTIFRLHYPLIADPAHGSGVLSAMYLVKDAILPEYRRKLATIEIANRGRMVRDSRFWLSHMANVVKDSPGVLKFGQAWLRKRTFASRKLPFVVVRSRDGSYPLDVNAEQVPNADSRVTLTGERDAYGLPRLQVDWRLHRQDIDSLVRSMRVARDAFARSGTATLTFDDATIEDEVRASTPVGGHHIGTARMAESPRDGVVDAHCAVHGVPNLYVASAAVFPTSSHANPTLTIVALALRLADHLKACAAREAAPAPKAVPELT
ncbi:GMC oxidoreductase [Teichococcus aestuarii]|uniref:FAD-dependent oxidoreductase n=1 Tax=Teichococcus aestuarii TaxID=568898 RepID=A0A2U1V462_9PROT|nr:GMC family oxidoreductase [Pseudoroseomonas aestuarii]PWC28708.1 FAD-dependent oxidoreductase [Pseudoroseomonas aestuarii]